MITLMTPTSFLTLSDGQVLRRSIAPTTGLNYGGATTTLSMIRLCQPDKLAGLVLPI